ncbi:MAG: GNAT family N-acetyltransferase [Treponema sp.]|nr:GNAT family N-acetyltransferase [Treponema sp.]
MNFLLTDVLLEAIIQALENQEEKFLVDAEKATLVSACGKVADEELFYSLPSWTSASGFELRENFVRFLHNPLARESLMDVLHSGRGVFRNFKNELKNYPVIERRWNLYKNKKMRLFVDDWYNSLCEVWGLEKLDIEPEDNDYVLLDDFAFLPYKKEDSSFISSVLDSADDYEKDWPYEIDVAVRDLWKKWFLSFASDSQDGFVSYTLSNEFAGFITLSPVSERTQDIVVITGFYVQEKFRGLGIGTELLGKCLSYLKSRNKKWVLLTYTVIPDSLESLLLRSGFQKTGSVFSAKIQ